MTYAIVPSEMIFDKNIRSDAVVFYAYVSTKTDKKGKYVDMLADIATKFDQSTTKIVRWIDTLTKNGYLYLYEPISEFVKLSIYPTEYVAKPKAIKQPKINYAEFVTMTEEEYNKLIARVGKEGTKKCIEILDNYKGAKGVKYASDYRAILNWVVKKYQTEINSGFIEIAESGLLNESW